MSQIQSISKRASFVKNEKELSIVISSAADRSKAKNVGIILALWFTGGIFIGINYFSVDDKNMKLFILVYLAFWLYFSYIIGKAFMWQWNGKELIKIRDGKLIYKKDVSGRGFVIDYPLTEISNVRKYGEKTPGWVKSIGGDYWSVDCDSIAFDYQGKEIPLGYKLDEKEQEKVLRLLKEEIK
ncbi:MAG: hypothetical protein M3R17_06355 [Bacteroidota bacterium]|nr:hypothetical protein [Bacteroidota bacterium]